MHRELSGEADFEGFRRHARALLTEGVPPDRVAWSVAGRAEPGLLAQAARKAAPVVHDVPVESAALRASAASPAAASSADAAPPRVPPAFVELCREVALHRDPQRHALMYRLLWRLQHEPALRADPLDEDMSRARLMAQAVRRDMHKMKAFVRFREVAQDDGKPPLHVAWFEPEHHIVEAVAPSFSRRFTAMHWAVLTPERCVRWDGERLEFSPGARREDAPPADAGEALWLTYYASIFNPARLKLRAMEKEMPRRYWHNLPEAELISGLTAQATERSGGMIERAPTVPPPAARRMLAGRIERAPGDADVIDRARVGGVDSGSFRADGRHGDGSSIGNDDTGNESPTGAVTTHRIEWQARRQAASTCRECPIGALATQTVWGEGPLGARLMLVGEQPGDQEDLQGRPFVGPAGQLLARAMAELGWDRSQLYLTNAVKHFKYEPRGKRRMHKTAAQREADACLHWLESEIATVKPGAIVALGATASRQLLGRPVAVTRERGQWLMRPDGLRVLVTLHPSALLRTDAPDRDAAYAAWLQDLRLADPR